MTLPPELGEPVDRRAVAHVVGEHVAAGQDLAALARQLQAPLEERPVGDDVVLGEQVGDVAGGRALGHGDDRLARALAGVERRRLEEGDQEPGEQDADQDQRRGRGSGGAVYRSAVPRGGRGIPAVSPEAAAEHPVAAFVAAGLILVDSAAPAPPSRGALAALAALGGCLGLARFLRLAAPRLALAAAALALERVGVVAAELVGRRLQPVARRRVRLPSVSANQSSPGSLRHRRSSPCECPK